MAHIVQIPDETRAKLPGGRSLPIWDHLADGIVGDKGPFSRPGFHTNLDTLAKLGPNRFPYGPPGVDMIWGKRETPSIRRLLTSCPNFGLPTPVFAKIIRNLTFECIWGEFQLRCYVGFYAFHVVRII